MDGLETENEHQGTGCVKQEKENEERKTCNGKRGTRIGIRKQTPKEKMTMENRK